jgi:hypothetical protein
MSSPCQCCLSMWMLYSYVQAACSSSCCTHTGADTAMNFGNGDSHGHRHGHGQCSWSWPRTWTWTIGIVKVLLGIEGVAASGAPQIQTFLLVY